MFKSLFFLCAMSGFTHLQLSKGGLCSFEVAEKIANCEHCVNGLLKLLESQDDSTFSFERWKGVKGGDGLRVWRVWVDKHLG